MGSKTWDAFSFGFRESLFQAVVARASRPCVGCTIRTGGTPVPLRWKHRGRRISFAPKQTTARRGVDVLDLQLSRCPKGHVALSIHDFKPPALPEDSDFNLARSDGASK